MDFSLINLVFQEKSLLSVQIIEVSRRRTGLSTELRKPILSVRADTVGLSTKQSLSVRADDFLWKIGKATSIAGYLKIFNLSFNWCSVLMQS